MRKILNFQGTIDGAGYPSLDVTANEIAVANIPNLAYWPGLFSWDIPLAGNVFQDRMTDANCATEGAVAVAPAFTAAPGGGTAYRIAAGADRLRGAFNAAGSFTIGLRVAIDSTLATPGFSFGSYTAADETANPAPWWVSTTGVLPTLNVGARFGNVTANWVAGGAVTPDVFHRFIFVFDRTNTRLRMYFNDPVTAKLEAISAPVAALALLQELQIGGVRVGLAANQIRGGWYKKAIAFTRALTAAELVTLDAMLAEA